MPTIRKGAIVIATILALTACTAPAPKPTATRATSATSSATSSASSGPSELNKYYAQQLRWKECTASQAEDPATGQECAMMTVPLDYAKPDGETIKIAVSRIQTKDAKGTLVTNPGGPGGSGVDFLSYFDTIAGSSLKQNYDLVSFDPRGVGHSTPAISCLSDQQLDEFLAASVNQSDPNAYQESVDEMTAFGQDCKSKTGDALGHVDTVSAAKDMDVLRAVLGQDKLDYLGFSYGTFLGATYAEQFPQHAGRLVLDGAVDPSLSESQQSIDQMGAFEKELQTYVAYCQSHTKCPLTGSVSDGVQQIQELLAKTQATPLPTGDSNRPLTVALEVSTIIGLLYEDDYWSMLTTLLTEALDGDGAKMLQVSDALSYRDSSGHYTTNSNVAIYAVNCLDSPGSTDEAAIKAEATKVDQASPTFGPYMGYDVSCGVWPYKAIGAPHQIHAPGVGPILVVGTTGDPATPYQWAESLTKQLDDAVLLTYKGEGHTAYGRSNSCIVKAVDAFLVDGKTPKVGTTC